MGLTHYAIDIHGCRYRNWHPSGEAINAPAQEPHVKPLQLPLESLIPQGVDNL
ncbi:FAD-dependent oxidoreductase [Nodosilinea sp. LEGE 07088]|uniref:FAD-dependent oxidoreductase n=1 Tax=Nodosilinea sp. LEGE 07088 TaxID=2777968 RepID=UPI001D134D64|nr:FAD-dependent oxidoreductase [Nodosilinea sp. LEGE 07088]